jgi:D-alanine-D-alanine ligase
MARTIVGVLRGGTSSEYDLSLKTGAAMLSALPEDRFDTRDIFIDKRGYWHNRGMPVDPARALSQLDVVLNGLHGGVGEDGTVQRILERSGTPYVGSRPLASGLSLNKIRARDILRRAGVRMPQAVWFSLEDNFPTGDMARSVFAIFGPPYIIKPPSEGASHGIVIAHTIAELPDRIGDVLESFGHALVEQFIRGSQASVAVIERYRGEELYALPPAEIILPEGSRIFERSHHENQQHKHIVPGTFNRDQKKLLMDAAKSAHRALELSHFSRSDFILTPNAAYLLETNALPGLYPGAALPEMLESVGSSVPEFLQHSIALARN